MEKDIKLGEVGKLVLTASKGKVTLSVQGELDAGALGVGASITADVDHLVDQLQALVEKAIPISQPIDGALFGALKLALHALE